MVSNHVLAGLVLPKMLPLPRNRGCAPRQIGRGEVPSLNVCTAPAKSGVAPMNAADLYSSVVPVLAIIGRVHFALRAAWAAVPLPTSSLLMPTARPFARPSATTCSHGASFTCTALPLRSSTFAIGVGGHHLPPLTM